MDGPCNSLVARTLGAISVRRTLSRTDKVDTYIILSTQVTGCMIAHQSLTVIPMPKSVIQCVNNLSSDQPCLLICKEVSYGNDTITPPPETPHKIPAGVVCDTTRIPGVGEAEGAIEDTAVEEMSGQENNDHHGTMFDTL